MAADSTEQIERRQEMRKHVRRAADQLGLLDEPTRPPISRLRRTGLGPVIDPRLWLALVDDNGVWRLREEGTSAGAPSGRRARRARRMGSAGDGFDDGELIPLKRLPKDKIRQALEALDLKLTPQRGLRQLDLKSRTPGAALPHAGPKTPRVLVLVHGTFSEGQSFLNGLARAPDRADALFAGLAKRYDRVFLFDHPTLTVDPIMNARELALALAPCATTVDIVAHSRGGLVTRWWADALDKGNAVPGRTVFVGSPLAGTGLAAAPNLRKTLDLMANVSAGLGFASAGVPFLQAAVGLFQVFSSAVRFAAGVPVPDVLIGLVPGLRAMSLVANNAELESLRRRALAPGAERFFVRSNFESEAVGWRFWKLFRQPLQRLKDVGADAIFDGENDLVVDTASMADWAGAGGRAIKRNILDYGTTDTVHHTNYFEQARTVDFIGRALLTP